MIQKEIQGTWPPSQVGLLADGLKARFNGITFFQIPHSTSPTDPAEGRL